jgi:serine/threonine protein kinase
MFHHWLSHVQRILRGHPNIVYLIDASWSQMPNGMTEAFVLMEFCQGRAGVHCGSRHLLTDLLRVGGGIIDMMNRRLRERLTEAEILTIFVDVCEGVAAMHNLKPALLHRDLKVENILQSSATSYKLCDFGSTAAVARPPSSTQEIRMLEADLNRHTTLQYRAPEMVDAYLRRPIDEKSDVWALGVLLYKLCYYTTPFEEHGPLAILNVQYRIPPYPVYSAQMNALIGMVQRSNFACRTDGPGQRQCSRSMVHKGRPFSRSSMWCTHCVGPSLASRINCPLPRHCRRPHSASRQTRWTGSYPTVRGLRPLRLVCNLGRITPVRPMRRLLGTRFWMR